jgi:DNA polymerase-3 subunit alpha
MLKTKKISILNEVYEIEPFNFDIEINEALDNIYDITSSVCQNCKLSQLEVNKELVISTGYPRSKIMIISLNPSNNRRGNRVFGVQDNINHSIVESMLKKVNLTFDNVYITNILKCSTENNKIDTEILPLCIKNKLIHEISIVDPELIICLGETVSNFFGIDFRGNTNVIKNGDYIIAKAYHPSYYARKNGEGAENNFLEFKKIIDEINLKTFVNLHVHNEFSIRDGIGTVDEHVLWALKHKSPAVSLTNHGNISVFFKQYESCKKARIKPIFGVEAYIIDDREKLIPWINSKEEDAVEKRKEFGGTRHHILLLAKNYIGLKNIFKITSKSYIESFYKFPLIDFKLLSENKEGIIVSTACAGGELNKYIAQKEYDKAIEYIEKYKKEFGSDFYIELMSMNYNVQWNLNKDLWNLAKKTNVKTIITTDSHYLYPEDQKVHEAILLLQTKKSYKEEDEDSNENEILEEEILENENEKLWEFTVKDLYLKTYEHILDDWKNKRWFGNDYDNEEEYLEVLTTCLKNTYEVFTKIENFEIDTSIKIPKLYENSAEVLKKKIAFGLKTRKIDKTRLDEYKKRCKLEYDTIVKMNFSEYFLILEDLINWTKNKFGKYSVGDGRGSSAGSLVNYLLNITNVDPIKHDLLFERFLDEGRKDLPDVDIDFAPEIRDEVKKYLVEKYGEDKVATIGNYHVAKVKSSIKDAARIYNIDFSEVNKVTNAIPYFVYVDGKKDTIDNLSYEYIINNFSAVRDFLNKYPDVDKLFKRLRNSIKAIGRHAAGVVVSSVTLYDWIPLIRSKEHIVTANTEGGDYHELTGQGFVKFDILGLNNLSVVNDTVRLIRERYNITIDWDDIDLESPEAYAIARKGDTLGVFQFESNLATKTTIDIQPNSFSDLSAINAVIRPGPLDMGMHKQFAERKRKGDWRNEIHESYADLLKSTYGIILYQEDFMRIFKEIGKFNAIEVNKARKDLVKYERSKKYESARLKRVASWKDKFVQNASLVMPEDIAEKLWNEISAFARYGFNKCLYHDSIVYKKGKNGLIYRKYIKNVKAGEIVLSSTGAQIVKRVYKNGKKQLYKIKTKLGKELICTLDHKIMTSSGKMKSLREILRNKDLIKILPNMD